MPADAHPPDPPSTDPAARRTATATAAAAATDPTLAAEQRYLAHARAQLDRMRRKTEAQRDQAAASRVDVGAWTDGPWLRLRVVDDGIGGADPSRGTGLTGLRQRVASLDGRLTVESPLGGPTVLEVTLPCAS